MYKNKFLKLLTKQKINKTLKKKNILIIVKYFSNKFLKFFDGENPFQFPKSGYIPLLTHRRV